MTKLEVKRFATRTALWSLLALVPMAAWAAPAAPAEEPEAAKPTAAELLREAVLPLELTAEGLTGPGLEKIVGAATAARFVLVGEPHYTRETAELVRFLGEALAPAGFTVFAVETGPISAIELTELARQGLPAFEKALGATPEAFPFFNAPEEIAILTSLARRGYRFWGLDQEFILAGRLHLKRLAELARNDEAREVAGRLLVASEAGYEERLAGNQRPPVFLGSAEEADFTALRRAFEPDGNAAALRIIDEMERSWRVYKMFLDGEIYRSNATRIRLMKEHFYRYWEGETQPPKILFKFGSYHMGKGLSPLHLLDLGNLAHELALSLGGESFHIEVVGRARQPAEGEEQDLAARRPELAEVFAACPEGKWCAVDLTALRPSAFQGERSPLPEGLRDLAWHYDALVVVPVLHATRGIPER